MSMMPFIPLGSLLVLHQGLNFDSEPQIPSLPGASCSPALPLTHLPATLVPDKSAAVWLSILPDKLLQLFSLGD